MFFLRCSQLSPAQKLEFLGALISGDPLTVDKLEAMLSLYHLDQTTNLELNFRWIRVGLKARWEPSVAAALDLVSQVGRMKFVRPLYRDLYGWEEQRQTAVANFLAHRGEMMYVTADMVAKDLHVK